MLLPWIRRHSVHRAGLLTPGYKRCLSRLPTRKCEALLHAFKAVTLARCIRIESDRRGDKLLASYSSATASELHRLPYSAWLTCVSPRPPGDYSYIAVTGDSIRNRNMQCQMTRIIIKHMNRYSRHDLRSCRLYLFICLIII